jgi:hypothetical protein
MADNSTPVPMESFTTDPMFQVYTKLGEIETKISDSIFENYKLQVAQTNDLNNRAMQTAFHTDSALAALKQTVNDANTQSMLAAERLKSAVQLAAAHTAEVVMSEGGATNGIIGSIDRENLSRELTDRATEVIALREGFRGWERDWVGLQGVTQVAGVSSQISALGSQLQGVGQGFVNTGLAVDTSQTATPTNIG